MPWDRILETQITYLRRVLAADVDAVSFGDDWGTQDALMISPDQWRRIFKPAYRRLLYITDEVPLANVEAALDAFLSM